MFRPALARFVAFVVLAAPVIATTVRPPDFATMVHQSDYVVHGQVTKVTCVRDDRDGHRRIITLVEINPLEVVAGEAPAKIELRLLGGRIGDEALIVSGQPQFQIGDEDVLFVRGNGVSLSPLYAMMFGRYPVQTDAVNGQKTVRREDGSTLHRVAEISTPLRESDTPPPTSDITTPATPDAAGLRLTAFKELIRATRAETPNDRHE